VWSNARLYNGRSSQISKAADRLEGVFEEALASAKAGQVFDFGAVNKDEDAVMLRTMPIGSDRLGRLYYLDQIGPRLVVEDSEAIEGYKLSYYSTREQIDALTAFLDVKVREDKALLEWLSRNDNSVIAQERQLSGAAAASASAASHTSFESQLGQLTHILKSSVEAIPQVARLAPSKFTHALMRLMHVAALSSFLFSRCVPFHSLRSSSTLGARVRPP
jgi:hypothetical protein